jgi:hypothetical protein
LQNAISESNTLETVTTPFYDGMLLICDNCQAKVDVALLADPHGEPLADAWRKWIKAQMPEWFPGIKIRPMRSSCQSLCVDNKIALTLTQNHPFKQQTFLVDPRVSEAELQGLIQGFFEELQSD